MKTILIALIFGFSFSVFSQNVKTETSYKYEIRGKKEIKIMTSEKTFDEKGNKIKDVSFSSDGKITKIKTYTYDSENNILIEIISDEKEKITKNTMYKYENGKRVSKTVEDGSGNIKSKKEYTYTYF